MIMKHMHQLTTVETLDQWWSCCCHHQNVIKTVRPREFKKRGGERTLTTILSVCLRTEPGRNSREFFFSKSWFCCFLLCTRREVKWIEEHHCGNMLKRKKKMGTLINAKPALLVSWKRCNCWWAVHSISFVLLLMCRSSSWNICESMKSSTNMTMRKSH